MEIDLEAIRIHVAADETEQQGVCETCLDNQRALLEEVERLPDFPRFWAFASNRFYPCGGMGDMVGRFDTVAAAREALIALGNADDRYVVDVTTGETVLTVEWGATATVAAHK
jgi:hypothetical protein